MNKTNLAGISIMITASFLYAWQLPFRQFAVTYGMESIQIILWANIIASVATLPFIPLCWQKKPQLAGIFGLAIGRSLAITGYFQALQTLPPALAVIFFFSGPLFVLSQTTLLRLEKMNIIQIIGFFLGIAGLAISLDFELHISFIGIAWAFLGGFGFSWEYLSTKMWIKPGQELSGTLLSIVVSNLFIVPIAIYYQQTSIPPVFPESWYPLMLMAILSVIVPTLLLLLCIRLIGANTASIISLSEPLFAIGLAITFGWDDPTIQTWTGIFILLFALFLVTKYQPDTQTNN